MARIAIVDDHPIVREGIEALLQRGGHDIVASAADGASLVRAIRGARPDLVIVDLNLPDCSGLDLVEQLRAEPRTPRIILLTSNIPGDQVARAMALEVDGIVLKETATQQLRRCTEAALSGEKWYDPEVTRRAFGPAKAAGPPISPLLSPREAEIVELVVTGQRNKEIAQLLDITEGTVKTHLHNIYEKLGVRSRMQLAHVARSGPSTQL